MDIVTGLHRTIITAVHDLNIATMYCDRLYAVKAGRFVTCGTPQEILTRELIRDIYEVDAEFLQDSDGVPHIFFRPNSWKKSQ